MIDPVRRKELIRKVGIRRITAAPDLQDNWSRRLAAMAKPSVLLRTLLVASVSILVAGSVGACAVVTAGYSLVDRDNIRLARLVADLVPDAAVLSEADLRIRFRSASRAITIIDQTIVARPADPAALTWFERVFGIPAPQVDPGREAVLLGIVDRLAALPIEHRADAVDDMMQWVSLGRHREAWSLMKHIGEQPPEIRQALLAANFEGLRQVLAWLRERLGQRPVVESLTKAIEAHRLELAEEIKRMEALNQSLRRDAEGLRGRRFACRRQASDLDSCLGQRPR